MKCPHCKLPMRLDFQTETQILWICPICKHMSVEDIDGQPAPYDDVGDWHR